MTQLPTDPIRAEHRDLIPHLAHVENAAVRVTAWDAAEAGRVLPRIVAFLRDDLIPHATAEEEVLYPAVDRLVGADVTATMTADHVVIGERIEALAAAVDRALPHWEDRDMVGDLSRRLAAIAAIVDLHFRKEEEVLLPILDAGMSVTEGLQLFERMGHDAHGHDHV
jgi:iron-sulfur cluster repair protein YtfE (RIC family)